MLLRTGATVLALAALTSGCYRYNRTARRYGGEVPLTLVNDSPHTVCYVRMSPSTDNNWGDDWLGPRETIPSGGGRTFALMGGPAWDIRLQTCQHQIIAEARQVPVMSQTMVSVSQLMRPAMPAPAGAVYVQPMQKQFASSGN
jgi:hypothetical protein